MKKRVLAIVGARPNFIKITQFERVFGQYPEEFEYRLLHTGQHFDENMSKVFFHQLKIKAPDYHLNIQGHAPIGQIGRIILSLEEVVKEYQPDILIVVGDVNSTLAATIVANKMGIALAHVESGLRSQDRGMPEEINRILTDELADFLLITEESGRENLLAEGKPASKIHFVGNTMIDTLVAFDEDIQASPILEKLGVKEQEFVLVTMHRPATVDDKDNLVLMLNVLESITKQFPIVFPIHPRTLKRLETFGLKDQVTQNERIKLSPPMDYLAFQKLIATAKFVLTDSGGIQEETTFRQVPCLTLRPSTERPSTITLGTNELITFDLEDIQQKVAAIVNGTYKTDSQIPPYWDGKATERIVEVLREQTKER